MIGGNTEIQLQIKVASQNEIGEDVPAWTTVWTHTGFIDLQSGSSSSTTFNTKIQESTHLFIGDYKPIPSEMEIEGKIVKVNAESSRIIANMQEYDVMLIDNPMGLNKQLEIYLKYVGGQV